MIKQIEQIFLAYLTRYLRFDAVLMAIIYFIAVAIWISGVQRVSELGSDHLEKHTVDSLYAFLIGSGYLFSMLMRRNLESHFSHAAARLIPNYATPHLIVAAIFWAGFVLYELHILQQLHVEPRAALASALFAPGLNIVMFYLESNKRHKREIFGWLSSLLLLSLRVFQSLILLMFVNNWLSSYQVFYQLLWGELPFVARGLIAFGLCAPMLAIRAVMRLPTQIYEHSPTLHPLGRRLQQDQNGNVPAKIQGHDTSRERPGSVHSSRFDRLMLRRPTINRSQLWIAGQQYCGAQIALLAGICAASVCLCCGVMVQLGILKWQVSDDSWTIPLIFTTTFDACAGYLVHCWSRRQSLLGMELLRPLKRDAFVRQWYISLAVDFTPIAIGQFAGTAALIWTCMKFNPPEHWILGATLWFVLRVTTSYSLALFFVRFLAFVCVVYVYYYAGMNLTDFSAIDSYPLIPQIVGLVAITTFLVAVRRYWHIAELN
jgi:hypothetical protein